MMRTASRRFRALGKHFVNTPSHSSLSPNFVVSPRTSLVYETVQIRLHGLEPNQLVRLALTVVENKLRFESHAIYKARPDGIVDLENDASLPGGTYTGKEPMGLFWSLQPSPGQGEGLRFTKKHVTVPMFYHLKALNETENSESSVNELIAETTLEKAYIGEGVRRIPIKEGKLKGTLFIPKGDGPFAGLIDMFGGLVSLVETRAALLASQGFVTFALAYLYQEDLAQNIFDIELDYIESATEWLSKQPFVDAERMGMVGLCYGGCLSLLTAARVPQIKAVVNINGTSITPASGIRIHTQCEKGHPWPKPENIYKTKEGIVLIGLWDCDNPRIVPAYQHGAKILFIVGEDDKQVNPQMHQFCKENWPPEFKQNFEMYSYPGAGHLIEPPYSPFCRAVNPTKKKMASVNFIPPEFHDELIMAGGYLEQHAHAQIDAWKKITEFLHRTLATSLVNK